MQLKDWNKTHIFFEQNRKKQRHCLIMKILKRLLNARVSLVYYSWTQVLFASISLFLPFRRALQRKIWLKINFLSFSQHASKARPFFMTNDCELKCTWCISPLQRKLSFLCLFYGRVLMYAVFALFSSFTTLSL